MSQGNSNSAPTPPGFIETSTSSISNQAEPVSKKPQSEKDISSPGPAITVEETPPNRNRQRQNVGTPAPQIGVEEVKTPPIFEPPLPNVGSPAPETAVEEHDPLATELRFLGVEGKKHIARVAILLCNISDRPLHYKFKTDTFDLITALPSATGHIPSRGSSRVVLSWQLPKHAKKWTKLPSPKLLLVTRFLDGPKDTTSTRLVAYMDTSVTCPSDNPPIEQLMLDALTETSGNAREITVTKSNEKLDNLQNGVGNDPQNANTTILLVFLAIFVAICLYRAMSPEPIVLR